MDDARRVRRVEPGRDLGDQARGFVWRQRSALGNEVAERLPRHVLHHHEGVRAVAALVEDRHDVRVDDRRGAACLVGEACAERVVGVRAEQLDRNVAIELLVAPAPDLAGAAFVDALEQAVAVREDASFVRGGAPDHRRPLFARHALARPQVARHHRRLRKDAYLGGAGAAPAMSRSPAPPGSAPSNCRRASVPPCVAQDYVSETRAWSASS